MKKCLLISFFNSHNVGDRVIANTLAKRCSVFYDVSKCSYEGSLIIKSETEYNYGFKEYIKHKLAIIYNSLFTHTKSEPILSKDIMKSIQNVDVVVIGGGNMLMYDYYKTFKLYIEYAKKLNKCVIACDLGIGPFVNSSQHKETCYWLDKCDVVTFRDENSFSMANEFCKSKNLFMAIDPCFFTEKYNVFQFDTCKNKTVVGINIMDISLDPQIKVNEMQLFEAIKNVLTYLNEQGKYIFVLFSTVYEDYSTLYRLRRFLKRNRISVEIKKIYQKKDVEEFYPLCRMIIAMRMHSLIFSQQFSIPYYGIIWQDKVKEFFKITNNNNCISINDFCNYENDVCIEVMNLLRGIYDISQIDSSLELSDLNVLKEYS